MLTAKVGTVLLLLSLGACSSVPNQNTVAQTDEAYVNAVNQVAASRGVVVLWHTYPTKSETKQQ